jgi:hypothetical protein
MTSNIRNPEAFAKRKAERALRRKRKQTLPQHYAIKKDVLLKDGSKVNIPVGDILRVISRQRMQKQTDKYPKAFKSFHRKILP